jgi:hypothetical protein
MERNFAIYKKKCTNHRWSQNIQTNKKNYLNICESIKYGFPLETVLWWHAEEEAKQTMFSIFSVYTKILSEQNEEEEHNRY